MASTTITIPDADRAREYELDVDYDWLERGSIETNSARCTEITIHCGDVAVSAKPADDPEESLERKVGEWCLAEYAEQVEAAIARYLEAKTDTDRE